SQDNGAIGLGAWQARDDTGVAQLQQGAVIGEPIGLQRRVAGGSVGNRGQVGRGAVRVRNALPQQFVGKRTEVGKFAAATLTHGFGQVLRVVGEIQERLFAAPFLS